MALIEMNNACKTFEATIRREGSFGTLLSFVKPLTKKVSAVKDISFFVEKGESVAYLGPNGAGKSTTIKMLTGILVPTSGEIKVNGVVPYKNRKKNSYNMGVVFGQRSQLLYDLPVQDSFDLLRYIYDIPRARYLENLKKFSEVLEVDCFIKRPVRTLSLGQRMRCEILASLLHEPEILFLDEPTIGLDVVAKDRIRNFIEEINKERGITVMLTTHDLADIERLCPRLVIIDKGTKVYDGSLQLIKERYAIERKISVTMSSESAANNLAAYLRNNALLNVYAEGNIVKVSYNHRKIDTSNLLRDVLAKANPNDLSMSDENIEAIIRRIYEEGVEDVALKPNVIEVAGI